ncbi:lysophospholipase [Paenibacillus typhae]|uniref:lysophospholipase n=1 Tax=Paenibacillus typhae TaxID=1174501 RepID=UPI001C8E0D56|nr:lysophospholipase [Paenibacillus typhae]MBY0009107.1 hypothetical protein [Paenibacillus typhae]
MGGEFYINRLNEHLIDHYLVNENKSAIIDFTKNSDTLLITFTGRGRVINPETPPPFNFYRSTQHMDINKIFIRDHKRAWFHKGLTNIYGVEDFNQLVTYLEDIIPVNRFNKIIVLGLSMGGYAALLFGLLTKLVVTVHSFGPQTFINTDNEEYNDQTKWLIPCLKEVQSEIPRNYLDLKEIFLERSKDSLKRNNEFHIHYGNPDKTFAERLCEFERVHLHHYNIDEHNVPTYLRDKGELKGTLDSFLNFSLNKT